MVVIAIIAVLGSLLLPTLGMVKGHASKTVCQSNLRQLGQATNMYVSACDDILPRPTATPNDNASWFYALDPYLLDTLPGDAVDTRRKVALIKQDPVWKTLSESDRLNWRTIKMNKKLLGAKTGTSVSGSVDTWSPSWRRFGSIANPSTTVLLFDGRCEDANSPADRSRFDGWEPYVARRHSGGANILFVDGHVRCHKETAQSGGTGWQTDKTSLNWWVDP